MALTQAERSARHKEKLRKQGRVLLHLWIDAELDTLIKKLLSTNKNLSDLSKEKALQTVLFDAVKCVTSNVTSNEINVASNNKILDENKELTAKVERLQTRLNELENSVTSNVTSNESIVPSNVATNEKSVADNLIFNLEKSKVIATKLRGQGLTANQISKELANRGYGNKNGAPFIKSSVNKWFQKKA
jgi:hypothetical protein